MGADGTQQDDCSDTRSALDEYRFNDVAEILYHFTWHTFCDWYIELSKPMLESETADTTKWVLVHVFRTILEMLHPIIPFVTEEVWQLIPREKTRVYNHYEFPFC